MLARSPGAHEDAIGGAEVYNDDVIRPLNNPLRHLAARPSFTETLRRTVASSSPLLPIRVCYSTPDPRIVFDSYEEMTRAVNDLDLDVTPDHVMVLRNAGPLGGPGMPEWGMLPIPKKLLRQGVRDMLRISDARMSGTSYGACILHVAPEAYVKGPLAAVQTGDLITVDVATRTINVDLSDSRNLGSVEGIQAAFAGDYPRGYTHLFAQHVRQANDGCDFDFLEGAGGVPEPEIH